MMAPSNIALIRLAMHYTRVFKRLDDPRTSDSGHSAFRSSFHSKGIKASSLIKSDDAFMTYF